MKQLTIATAIVGFYYHLTTYLSLKLANFRMFDFKELFLKLLLTTGYFNEIVKNGRDFTRHGHIFSTV